MRASVGDAPWAPLGLPNSSSTEEEGARMRKALYAGGFLALSCAMGFADLDHTATFTGQVEAQVQAVAFAGVAVATGSFSVSGIPAGATIVSAFVHTND